MTFKTSEEIRDIIVELKDKANNAEDRTILFNFLDKLWLSKEEHEQRVEEFRKEFNGIVANMNFGRKINDLINKIFYVETK